MKSGVLGGGAFVALLVCAGPARAAYSPATTNGWFVTAGRTTGGATHTDLWLFNPDLTGLASVTLVFHPAVSSGGLGGTPVSSTVIILDARETKYLADVTSAVLPAGDGVFGAIEWQSNLPLLGLARNVSAAGGGTTGPIVGATPQNESMTPKTSSSDAINVLQLVGLNSGDTNFTSRLDVANTSDAVLPIEVRVVDLTQSVVGGVQARLLRARSCGWATSLQAVGAPRPRRPCASPWGSPPVRAFLLEESWRWPRSRTAARPTASRLSGSAKPPPSPRADRARRTR
jgi:hypothetical protein